MGTVSNIALSVIFGGIGAWLFYGYLKTNSKIEIKNKSWTPSRIVFLVAGIMILVTGFVYSSALDMVRQVCMAFCVIAFLLQRDGIGPEGVSSMGHFNTYKEVRAYDYKTEKNKFKVYFTLSDTGKVKDEYTQTIEFEQKDEERVKAYLKDKIGKKYIRMKKGK